MSYPKRKSNAVNARVGDTRRKMRHNLAEKKLGEKKDLAKSTCAADYCAEEERHVYFLVKVPPLQLFIKTALGVLCDR